MVLFSAQPVAWLALFSWQEPCMLRAVIQSVLTFGLSGKLLRWERFNCFYQQSSIRSVSLPKLKKLPWQKKNKCQSYKWYIYYKHTVFFLHCRHLLKSAYTKQGRLKNRLKSTKYGLWTETKYKCYSYRWESNKGNKWNLTLRFIVGATVLIWQKMNMRPDWGHACT